MKVLGIIILIIFLFCMISIGIDFNFEDDKLRLSLKVCGFLIQVYPKKNKDKEKQIEDKPEVQRPEKRKKEKAPKSNDKNKSLSDLHISLDDIFFLIKKVLHKIGRFGRSFNVDRFLLHYIASGVDPYNVAKKFAFVNASLSSLAPLCEKRFNCKDVSVWTDCDFEESISRLDLGFSIVIRIGAFFVLIFGIINSAIAMIIRNKAILFYQKHFDKNAYLDRLDAEKTIPNLMAKIDRFKASIKGKSKNISDINERTVKSNG